MIDEATEQMKEPETEKNETIEHKGKRVQIFKHVLPVSGDTIGIREVGIYTSRKMEAAAGVTKEESSNIKTPILAMLFDNQEELFKLFIPDLVLKPADFNPKKYTEDDLFDILLTVFHRGALHTGVGGAAVAKKFLEISTGGGARPHGKTDEPPGK